MYIYLYCFFISILFAYLYICNKDTPSFTIYIKKKNIFIAHKYIQYALLGLSFAPLFLLSALRYDVGVDYFFTYVPIFEKVAAGQTMAQVNTEPLFFLLNKLIVFLGGGTVWLFTITSFITLALFFISFYQQSENFFYSVVMFFCIESFFISLAYVRQFIALAIFFYAIKYVTGRNFIKFSVCMIIAFLFHKSAIMMFPVYFLTYIKLHPAILSGLIIVLTSCKQLISGLFELIISKTKYSVYIGSVYQASIGVYIEKFIMYAITFAALAFLYKKCKGNKKYYLFLNSAALLVYGSLNFNIAPQIDRVLFSYEIILILAIPFILQSISNQKIKNIVAFIIIAGFSIVTFNNVVMCHSHGVLPYRFVFNPSLAIV